MIRWHLVAQHFDWLLFSKLKAAKGVRALTGNRFVHQSPDGGWTEKTSSTRNYHPPYTSWLHFMVSISNLVNYTH